MHLQKPACSTSQLVAFKTMKKQNVTDGSVNGEYLRISSNLLGIGLLQQGTPKLVAFF